MPRDKPISGLAAEIIDSTPYVPVEDFGIAARQIRNAVKMDDAELVTKLLIEHYHIIIAALDKASGR